MPENKTGTPQVMALYSRHSTTRKNSQNKPGTDFLVMRSSFAGLLTPSSINWRWASASDLQAQKEALFLI